MESEQRSSREDAWRSRLARFAHSGLTVVEFCRRERVSPPSFYQWRKRLARGLQNAKTPSPAAPARGGCPGFVSTSAAPRPGFVPVTLALSAMAEVVFPNGVRIRVPAADREALRAAVLAGNDVCQEVA